MTFTSNISTFSQPKLATRFAYGKKREIQACSMEGLSEDEIRRAIPSVYAEGAHESRSARYAYIPTSYVLEGLKKEGFRVFAATQAITRDADRLGYAKHMLRLRHESSHMRSNTWDDAVNEIILINSHDGASAYQLMAGCFRFVCSNGLIRGDITSDVRVRHSGNVRDDVVEGAYQLLQSFEENTARRQAMRGTILTTGEQTAFARAALCARFPDKDEAPITAAAALEPRRYDDRAQDLWTTFNVLQENLVQGGVRTNDRRRRTRTRGINGIDQNVSVNRALSTLAEEMLKLKNANVAA